MKIYTSYHGITKRLKAANIQPISISRYSPKWANYPSLLTLAPTADMLHLSDKVYIPRFEAILNKLDPEQILSDIKDYSLTFGGKDIALLCYEKPGDFCHRQMVAEWLNFHFPDLKVEEWVSPEVKAKKS